jgi:hypothetical protein
MECISFSETLVNYRATRPFIPKYNFLIHGCDNSKSNPHTLILVWCILLRLCLTKIITQLPLFATYGVFIVHKLHYMFRLYGHPQVYHIYKNAKIIIIT